MLERAHLDLADELRLDERLIHDEWHELVQVAQDQFGLVVRGRGQRGHAMATDLHLGIPQHGSEHVDEVVLENGIKGLVVVWKCVPESLDRNGPQDQRVIPQETL